MLWVIALNIVGGLVVYLDERKVDRDFWIAVGAFTITVWFVYLAGLHRGLFE